MGNDPNREECRRIKVKGRSWLGVYLNDVTDGVLHNERRPHMIGILKEKYNEYMDTDESFYKETEAFVSTRRTAKEKKVFFRRMLSFLITEGGVREAYAARYPDEYRL